MPRTREQEMRMSHDDRIVVFLRSVSRRLLLGSILRQLVHALFFAVLVLVVYLAGRAVGLIDLRSGYPYLPAFAAIAYFALVGVPKIIRNWPTPLRAARAADAKLGLQEGLSTLVEVQGKEDLVSQLLHADVRQRLGRREPRQVAAVSSAGFLSAALLGVSLVGGTFFLSAPAQVQEEVARSSAGEERSESAPEVTLDAEALESYAEEVSRDAVRFGDQELAELAEALARLTDEVVAQEITEGEAVQKLEQLMEQVDGAYAEGEAPAYSPSDALAAADEALDDANPDDPEVQLSEEEVAAEEPDELTASADSADGLNS